MLSRNWKYRVKHFNSAFMTFMQFDNEMMSKVGGDL